MYVISNKTREDMIAFLVALKQLPGKDLKTENLKRRAALTIRKLRKSKMI